MLDIADVLAQCADSAALLQNSDGSFPKGHNGPRNNSDTFLRVTSHWATFFSIMYGVTGNGKYKRAAEKAYRYILLPENRPFGFSFLCIESENASLCVNGLIGQAWLLESLLDGYRYLKETRFIDTARDLVNKHVFNREYSLWHVLGLQGGKLGVHTTLNQQLWFSAMAHRVGGICNDALLIEKTNAFFNHLPGAVKTQRYGGYEIIDMKVNEKCFQKDIKQYLVLAIKSMLDADRIIRSKGYCAFSLFALAIVHATSTNLSVFSDPAVLSAVRKSVRALDLDIYQDTTNQFGFPYNPIGFEVAYVKTVFKDYLSEDGPSAEQWIERQFDLHMELDTMLMTKNTGDPNTLSSRICELARLYEYQTGKSALQ